MLQCSNCGAVVTPPNERAERKADYYEDDYSLTGTVRASTEMHRYFRYPEYIRLIGEVVQHHPPPARWMDVGCDHGFFLDDARRYGYDVVGVEPSRQARNYALNIGLQAYGDVSETTGEFDIVSMWHVLEHISDPAAMLDSLKEKMVKGATLCIRVPDAGGFWSRVLRDKWIWFQSHHHVVHYTSDTLRRIVERSGFEVSMIRSQKPNTDHTRFAYDLATSAFTSGMKMARVSLRDRLARQYQDITGQELFLIARKP